MITRKPLNFRLYSGDRFEPTNVVCDAFDMLWYCRIIEGLLDGVYSQITIDIDKVPFQTKFDF